jgi:hypothetical protein
MQPAPLQGADIIKHKISQLQEALQQQSPGYEELLRTIHVALHKDEELVHLLSEEEVGTIVAGLGKKTNIVIANLESKSTKNKTASGKSLKEVTASDL